MSTSTPFGKVSADLSGTHMLKADYKLPGGTQTDLGRFGGDNNVVVPRHVPPDPGPADRRLDEHAFL